MVKNKTIFISGKVISGLQRGRTFGFPTANVLLDNPDMAIDSGVYAVTILLREKPYVGMLYVGTRPTLNLTQKTIEIYIFDFNQDIYNQQINFKIVKKIREEKHFDSVDALIKQIKLDYETVKNYCMDC